MRNDNDQAATAMVRAADVPLCGLPIASESDALRPTTRGHRLGDIEQHFARDIDQHFARDIQDSHTDFYPLHGLDPQDPRD